MGMKGVFAADLHLDSTMVGRWNSEAGVHSNWIESFARLRDLVDVCNKEQADFLAICGDLYHTGRPSSEAVARTFDEFNRLETAKVIITNGNHDQTSVVSNHRTPIDAYIGSQPFCHHAAGETEAIEFNGLTMGLVPWHRVAGTNSLDATSDTLRQNISKLADEVSDTDRPSVMFGHFTVEEATFNSPMRSSERLMSTSVLEATVPTQELLDGPWSVVRAGHIHKRSGIYVGSTYKVSFAEADEEKGCEVIEIEEDGTISDQRFIPFDVRQLRAIDIVEGSDILYTTADDLKDRDILRVTLGSDQQLTDKNKRVIADLKKRGVEVQQWRHPRERKIVTNEGVGIDVDPRRAMQIYLNRHFEKPSERKRHLELFDDVVKNSEA